MIYRKLLVSQVLIISIPVWVSLLIRIGLQEVAFVIMIGLHISDLFCICLTSTALATITFSGT